jgi:pimeloyl-ACP methyl ester carboxylesterase
VSEQSQLINHRRLGEGPPLLLVHGLGGSSSNWDPVLELLEPHRELIVVDTPGFGKTPLAEGFVPSAVNVGHVLAELCTELGIERPHVAGNSLGGWTALEMAADDSVASCCAISPAGLWGKALGARPYESRRAARAMKPLALSVLSTERGRRTFLRGIFGQPEKLSAAEARKAFSDWIDAPGYIEANREMRIGVFDRGAAVRVPVIVAWGELDRLVRPPHREQLPASTRYVEKPGWGHTPTWDDPEGVADLLLEASAGERAESESTSAASL